MLLRFQPFLPGSLLAEMQKPPDLISEIRQRLIVLRCKPSLHDLYRITIFLPEAAKASNSSSCNSYLRPIQDRSANRATPLTLVQEFSEAGKISLDSDRGPCLH